MLHSQFLSLAVVLHGKRDGSDCRKLRDCDGLWSWDYWVWYKCWRWNQRQSFYLSYNGLDHDWHLNLLNRGCNRRQDRHLNRLDRSHSFLLNQWFFLNLIYWSLFHQWFHFDFRFLGNYDFRFNLFQLLRWYVIN